MATIVTRSGKGSPLTNAEVDANFTNLNTDKIQSGDSVASLDINGGTIDGTVIGGSTPAAISGTTGSFSGNLTVDTNTLFVDAANNRVGIGTSAPTHLFTVGEDSGGNPAKVSLGRSGLEEANIFFTRAGVNDAEITYTADEDLFIKNNFAAGDVLYSNNLGAHIFNTGSGGASEAMRITSAGNVGIGTSSPIQLLHLSKSGIAGMRIEDTDTAGGYTDLEVNGSAFFIDSYDEDGTEGLVVFRTAGTETMRIESSGNVGIGTSSPTGLLTIGSGVPRLDFLESDGSAGFDNTILVRDADVFSIQTRNGGTFVSNDYRMTANASGALTHEWRIGNTERMRIDSSGNVGIGTSSPNNPLHVAGEGTFTRGLQLGTAGVDATAYISQYRSTVETIMGPLTTRMLFGTVSNHDVAFLTNNTERMRIDTSGNVGIGTSSPGRALDVQTASGDADARIYAQGTTSSDDAILYLGIAGTTATNRINFGDVNDADRGRIIYGHSGDYMSFATAASEAMRIDASGRVGIGTSNPDTPLHVYKQSSDRTARFQRLSTQYIDIIQTSGANQIESAGKNFSIGTLGLESIAFRTNDTERMRIDSSGIVDILGGTVELNGNSLNGVQVTIADDAVAELTFTNRRFGLLNLVEGSNNDGFPVNGLYAIAYVDFGNTPDSDAVRSGNLIEFNDVDTLTGTTGTDGRVTVGTAGTSGTLYIENREGSSRVFNVTLM